jgi:hypothetical protein
MTSLPVKQIAKRKPRPIKDDDGIEVREGDVIHFSYGIPPVGVKAPVINRNGKLIVITKGHNPPECPLSSLRKHIGNFWVEMTPQARYERVGK